MVSNQRAVMLTCSLLGKLEFFCSKSLRRFIYLMNLQISLKGRRNWAGLLPYPCLGGGGLPSCAEGFVSSFWAGFSAGVADVVSSG